MRWVGKVPMGLWALGGPCTDWSTTPSLKGGTRTVKKRSVDGVRSRTKSLSDEKQMTDFTDTGTDVQIIGIATNRV